MKNLSLAVMMLTAFSSAASAAETVRLTDGRALLLNEDGTYEWPDSERAILIRLTNAGKAQGFMGDDRDCGLTFEIENQLDGRILAFDADLGVFDENGAPILFHGVMDYDIDMAILSDLDLVPGSSASYSLDIQSSCEDLSRITLETVDDKFCNFVHRQPGDVCKDLVRVESMVEGLPFTK